MPDRQKDVTKALRVYAYNIVLTALAVSLSYILYQIDPRPFPPVIDIIFWGALIAWASFTQVHLLFKTAISLLFVIALASLFVFPYWFVPILVFLFYFDPGWFDNPNQSLWADYFNRVQNSVSIAVAGSIYYAFTNYTSIDLFGINITYLLGIILSGFFFFLVNVVLVTEMVAIDTRSSFQKIWRENFSWLAYSYIILIPVALLLARLYDASPALIGNWGGWAVLLFLIPLYYARYHWDEYVKIRESFSQAVEALMSALEAKDSHTRLHSERVASIANDIAMAIGLDEADTQQIKLGARIHDIGKIGIPDSILLKPQKLTDEEMDIIKQHPTIGVQLLRNISFFKNILPIVKHHHERWDGAGYPDGLAGQDIHLWARIVGLADAYEAMTAGRPYKPAKTPEEGLKEIEKFSGIQFDPKLAKVFKELWEQNPVWRDREVFLRAYSSRESSLGLPSLLPKASESATTKERS